MSLPFGSYTGFASTSILEVLTAGYEAPDRGGVAVGRLCASSLMAGAGDGLACSLPFVFAVVAFAALDRCDWLKLQLPHAQAM